jgi:hypothetical protein
VKVRETSLERTLIDVTVRPGYAGGIEGVLNAYRRALDAISVSRPVNILKQLDYVYPYHQAVGFYMERAGFQDKQLSHVQSAGFEPGFLPRPWPPEQGVQQHLANSPSQRPPAPREHLVHFKQQAAICWMAV